MKARYSVNIKKYEDLIRDATKRKKLTLVKLSKRLGYCSSFVSNKISRGYMRRNTFNAMCVLLNLSADDLKAAGKPKKTKQKQPKIKAESKMRGFQTHVEILKVLLDGKTLINTNKEFEIVVDEGNILYANGKSIFHDDIKPEHFIIKTERFKLTKAIAETKAGKKVSRDCWFPNVYLIVSTENGIYAQKESDLEIYCLNEDDLIGNDYYVMHTREKEEWEKDTP